MPERAILPDVSALVEFFTTLIHGGTCPDCLGDLDLYGYCISCGQDSAVYREPEWC